MAWKPSEWSRDLRHAIRSLSRTPGFTVMAVGTLGLAIGATSAMFSVVNTVLLKPLPYPDADRLVVITASAPGSDMPPEFGASNEMYIQYKELSKSFEDISAPFAQGTSTMRAGDRVERIRMSWPTNTLYSTLGVKPLLGRLPTVDDRNTTAVISYRLWDTWFNRDSSVIGRSYFISDGMKTVIGVMGPDFKFPTDETLLWVSGEITVANLPPPGRFNGPLLARIKPGMKLEDAARELTTLASRLPERFGGSPGYARIIAQHKAIVKPFETTLFGDFARPLWVLFGAVGIVLLIACANVGNLFMVRAEGRHHDLAIRRAIGADRTELVRLQMAEAVVVAGLAGCLGVVLAWAALPLFLRSAPPGIPRLNEAGVSVTMLAFTLVMGVLSALLCGLFPAIRASVPDLRFLREGGRGSTGRRSWARDMLVAGQTALALVLITGSALLGRSFWKLSHVDPGYTTKDIFTFQIAPQRPSLNDGPSFARFHLDFMDRLRALPGVELVGVVDNIPLNEQTQGTRVYAEGRANDSDGLRANVTFTAGDYFQAMGIKLLDGRLFTVDDQVHLNGNALASKAAADLLWPGESPVGRRFKSPEDSTWTTVVGVVGNVMQNSFREDPQPVFYLPLVGPRADSWAVGSPAYVVKTPRAETIAADVRNLVREVAPEAPMYRIYTLAGLARDSMVQLSFTMLTLGIASALALILSAVGLYGVLSYVVAQRTREIGLRMALGAQATQVRQMVMAQGARVVGAGVVVGVVVALASTRALGSLLFGVAAMDTLTFVAVAVTMLFVGLLASYLPGRRASNVDPIVSMRSD
jgi:putative ABC transport system permease protein